jgi:hypothetical protein
MNGKWKKWLESSNGRPVPQLNFEYRTGSVGSLSDFSGNSFLILFSRACSTCREAIVRLMPIAQELSVPLLVLGDRAAKEDVLDPTDPKAQIVRMASASFPEIYVGFNIPRGAWLKFPTLFLLDPEGRVRVMSDVPDQMMDRDWVMDRMAECTTIPTARV